MRNMQHEKLRKEKDVRLIIDRHYKKNTNITTIYLY